MRHARSSRPALITDAPESPEQEFDRRRKRYAIMAVIFIACFTAGALAHRHTVLALLLCGIAMVTLPAAVITANVRSRPRSPKGVNQLLRGAQQLSGELPSAKFRRR
jgi:hypothetical protein